jgi:hypothetical protein
MKSQFQVIFTSLSLYIFSTAGAASAGEQFSPELTCLHFLTHYVAYGSGVRFEERNKASRNSIQTSDIDDDGNIFVAVQSQGANKNILVMTKDGIYSVPVGNNWITDPFKQKNAKVYPGGIFSGPEVEVGRAFGLELPNHQKISVDLFAHSYKSGGIDKLFTAGTDSFYQSTFESPEIVKSFQKSKYVNDLVVLGKAQEAMTPQTKSIFYASIKNALMNFSSDYFFMTKTDDGRHPDAWAKEMEITPAAMEAGSKACGSVDDPATKKFAQETLSAIQQDISRRHPTASGKNTSSAGTAQ